MAAGIRASQRQLEREADLPTPGSLLNADPSGGAYAGRGGGFGTSGVPSGSFRVGAADLNAPSNAGILPDTGAELQQRAERSKQRRVSRSLSEESLEVLALWDGNPSAPERYSCVVEDALLAQAQQTAEMMQQVEALGGQIENAQKVIDAAAEDNAAYRHAHQP